MVPVAKQKHIRKEGNEEEKLALRDPEVLHDRVTFEYVSGSFHAEHNVERQGCHDCGGNGGKRVRLPATDGHQEGSDLQIHADADT